MKVIKADLGDHKEVQILALADLHNGDKRSDGKKIMQYAELKSFKPASTETPIIHLDGTRRRMSATL